MLAGPSFRSAFVFCINLSVLPGFTLTSFHLPEASYHLLCVCRKAYDRKLFIWNVNQFTTIDVLM